MRYLLRPQIFLFSVAAIILVGLLTWAVQFLPFDLLSPQAPLDRSQASTAAIIVHRGKLRVGVRQDAQPFGFIDAEGQTAGFDVDLAHEFARRWLGDANALELVTVSAADRIPRLASGDVDLLIAAMPHKRERDAFIDFSQPYFVDGQTLLVHGDSDITALADLHGKIVGALQDSPGLETLQQLIDTQSTLLKTVTFPAYPQAVNALQAGQIDAIIADSVTLSQFAQAGPNLRLLGQRFTQEYYGIGIPQGDSRLRALVNFTLQDMKKDGTYDSFYQHWFPADEPLAIELSPGEWSYQKLSQLPPEPITLAPSHLENIIKRGRLVAAVHQNFWPFSSLDSNNQRVGFDLDLLHEFARRWLGDPNAVELIPDEPAAQIARLASGEVDLIAAALVEQREWAEQIDFSQTYLGAPIVSLPLAIGLPLDDPTFRELVDITLQEMKTDGAYDTIYHTWFGENATSYPITIIPGDAGYLLSNLNTLAFTPRVKAAGESAIARIQKRADVLRVGVATDLAPFGYRNADGELTGFDIELVQAIAQDWGVQLDLVPVTPADRIPKLLSGDIDMIAAGLQRNKAQAADIDFSQTYFLGGTSLLVKNNVGIQAITDLNDRVIAVVENVEAGDQLQAVAEANNVAVAITPYPSLGDALVALEQGDVAAILGDSVVLSQARKDDLILLNNLLNTTPYSLGLPADDSYFNNLVNITLQTLKQNGVYDQLYHKWFGADAVPYAIEILPGQWPYTFAQSPTKLDLPVRSKVEQIQQRGKIVAGVLRDLPPFGFLTADAQPTGFDVEILRDFASRWLGDANAVEFVPVTYADGAQKLAAGEVDILAAALPHLQNRDESIDFSQTYYQGAQALLFPVDAQISTLQELNGKVIAALQGSPASENIQALANREGLTINILPFQEFTKAVEALKARQVDGLTAPLAALNNLAARDGAFAVLTGVFPTEPYGLGIPNYDGRFQDLVNFTLQEMQEDGSYARIFRHWFDNVEPPNMELWPGTTYLELDMIPMVRIPAGEFTRGYRDGFPDERVEQTLFLDEFYLDRYEVTNRQYAACVRAGRCALPRLPRSVNFANYYASSEYGNYPVIWVTWNDAANYCAFRGKRLPTEAEWEKAARGANDTLYPWGNEEPTNQANFNYAASDVMAVGSFPADQSSYGVYDMAGNVREWVADWYQWDYYPIAPQKNPLGPATGVTKVLRGGSWNDVAIYVRATSRKNFLPESFDSNLGFRCATSTFPPAQ